MLQWSNQRIILKLNFSWTISRGSADEKTNFIISVREDEFQGLGEVAPNVRFGETPEQVEQEFQLFIQEGGTEISTYRELRELMVRLNFSQALKFGLESAFIHLQSLKMGITISEYLKLPQALPRATMFSIPIMDPGQVESFIQRWKLDRFHLLKVKVDSVRARDLVKQIAQITRKPLIIDGNESWEDPEQYLAFERSLPENRVVFIEQPLPAALKAEQHYVKSQRKIPVWADESFYGEPDWSLKEQFDGVNVKLMKAGGYFAGMQALEGARKHGLSTMIGCMVETSLGLAAAMRLSPLTSYLDLDSFLYLQDEPFEHVEENKGVLYLKTSS